MTSINYYTGIGSIETPQDCCNLMIIIAEKLNRKGWWLRSGHAPKADQSFEKGVKDNKKEIFLPWKGFEGSKSKYFYITEEAYKLAEKFHPKFNQLSIGAKKLIARDGYQVLGFSLKKPSKFIVCWTEDGKFSGGTGQALRIADYYKIPIYNLYSIDIIKLMEMIDSL